MDLIIDKQFWQFVNSFADWFSAVGTIGAVIVALYLARQDKRIRLFVYAGHRLIASQGQKGPHPEYLAIGITNIGYRDAQIVGIGWKVGFIKKRFAEQPPPVNDYISSPMPIRLQDGEEAKYYIPLTDPTMWLDDFVNDMLAPRVRWNAWFTHVLVYTSVGKVFEAHLEAGLRNRLIEYAKQNTMQNQE